MPPRSDAPLREMNDSSFYQDLNQATARAQGYKTGEVARNLATIECMNEQIASCYEAGRNANNKDYYSKRLWSINEFPERPVGYDSYRTVYKDVAETMEMTALYLKTMGNALKMSENIRFRQVDVNMVQGGFDQVKYGIGMLKRMTATYVDPVNRIVWNDFCRSCNLRTLRGFGGDPTDCGLYPVDEFGNVDMRRHVCQCAKQERIG